MLQSIIITAIVIALCHTSSSGAETNKQWERTDVAVKTLNTLYDNLAITVEDSSDKQKETFTIALSGLFSYMITEDATATIDLKDPADVMASDIRTAIDVMREVLDPAFNLVKKACRPETSTKECAKSLASAEQEEIKSCAGFTEHIQHRKATEELFNSEEYKKLLCDMLKVSEEESDEAALEFLNDLDEGQKYKKVMSELIKWYSDYLNGDYPCNLPPGACSEDDTDSSNETDSSEEEETDKDDKNDKAEKRKELERMYYEEMQKLYYNKHH